MKSIIILYFIVCISFIAKGQTNASIESLLQSEKITGAVWTTVQNDSIATFGAGIKCLDTGEKIKSTDKVHVGSITKTILALGILKLATENKIKIDEQVKTYLPNLPIQNDWEATNPVTIRHLLDHTSGLSDLRLWHFFSTTADPDTPLSEFYARNLGVLKAKEKPGQLFSYSNMGYTILGMIIEKVTNQRYEKYLDEHLLKPLEMHNSTFQFTSQEGSNKTNNLVMGHFDDGKIAPALPIYLRPAGQFTTTALDMGVLIKFILNKGKVNSKSLIDSAYFEDYGRPYYTIAFQNGLKNGYAYGLMLRDRHGVIGLAHSGNIIGYRAMLYIFPNEKKGFFISHNMDSESANYELFNQVLIDNLRISKNKKEVTNAEDTKGMSEYEGYYVPKFTKVEPLKLFDIMGSFSKIELKEKGLTVSPFQKQVIYLTYKGNGIFQSADKLSPSHYLYSNEQDKYLTTGISTLKKVSGWQISFSLLSSILGLFGLLAILVSGIYQTGKHRLNVVERPIFPVFTGVFIFVLSIVFIVTKNIIQIGNQNSGGVLLYCSSILLPVFTLISLILFIIKNKMQTLLRTINFWATILVFQLMLLLTVYGLISFATWK